MVPDDCYEASKRVPNYLKNIGKLSDNPQADRLLLVVLARMVWTWKQAPFLVQPETLLRWHREFFRVFWKHKSKAHARKPKLSPETISLIQEMATNNRLWGAERIRGELLKLNIRVSKRTIQKYMRQRCGPVIFCR